VPILTVPAVFSRVALMRMMVAGVAGVVLITEIASALRSVSPPVIALLGRAGDSGRYICAPLAAPASGFARDAARSCCDR
jgi:uncharacterized membrane protein YdfJ with MMPL/SSD domain